MRTVEPDIGSMSSVRLMDKHRHLGSWISDSGSLLPELKHRVGWARAALRPLRKPVFRCPGVSAASRAFLYRSLISSRACHNVGALSGMLAGELDAWQASLLGPCKALSSRPAFAADAHVDAATICREAGLPAPIALLRIERLAVFGQFLATGVPVPGTCWKLPWVARVVGFRTVLEL